MNIRVYLFLAIGLVALAGLSHAASFSVINTINGTNPAFSPSGLIAYTINGIATLPPNVVSQKYYIDVINTQTNTVTNTILFYSYGSPNSGRNLYQAAIAFSPKGGIAYITLDRQSPSGSTRRIIEVINVSTNTIIANINVSSDGLLGIQSTVFSPSGATAYVLARITDSSFITGSLNIINVSTNAIISSIAVSGVPFYRGLVSDLAINPSGTLLYITKSDGNVIVFNTTTNSNVDNITVGQNPQDIAINPSGNLGYVTNNGNVSVFSTSTNKVIDTIKVGSNPSYVVFNLNGSLAYVADSGSNNVSVISVNDNAVIYNINLNSSPQTEAFSPNPNIPLLYVGESDGTTSVIKQQAQSTCSGTPVLTLSPNPANPSSNVIATVTGLSDCNGYIVTIKDYEGCVSGNTITTFVSGATGGSAPSQNPGFNGAGTYGYYACVNGQSSAKAIITVTQPKVSYSVINTIISGPAVAFSPSGLIAYAANGTSNSINVISVPTNTIINSIPLPPIYDFTYYVVKNIAFSPSGKVAYVTYSYADMGAQVVVLGVVNVSTNTVISDEMLGGGYAYIGSSPVVFSPSGSIAYVGADNEGTGIIDVINVLTNNAINQITLPARQTEGIALNPTGTLAYVTSASSANGTIASTNVIVINTTTNSIVTNITVGEGPGGIAINPSGELGYVTDGNNVSVFSTSMNKVIKTISVGQNPSSVVFNLNGSLAFVADSGSNNVSVIDVNDNTVVNTINLGTSSQTLAYNPNPNIPFLYAGDSNGTIKVIAPGQVGGGGGGR